MKKLIVLIVAITLTTVLFGQNTTRHASAGWYIKLPSKDTVRTFHFNNIDIDTCRARLIRHWGSPAQNTAGLLSWANVQIPEIGSALNIHMTDMLCTMHKGDMKCVSFNGNNDKAKKLRKMKTNQFRELQLTITDNANTDLIIDKAKVEMIVQLIETIIQ